MNKRGNKKQQRQNTTRHRLSASGGFCGMSAIKDGDAPRKRHYLWEKCSDWLRLKTRLVISYTGVVCHISSQLCAPQRSHLRVCHHLWRNLCWSRIDLWCANRDCRFLRRLYELELPACWRRQYKLCHWNTSDLASDGLAYRRLLWWRPLPAPNPGYALDRFFREKISKVDCYKSKTRTGSPINITLRSL